MDDEAIWVSDKEMRQKDIFKDYVFGLGWWTADGKLERRSGGDPSSRKKGKKRERYGIDFALRDPSGREP